MAAKLSWATPRREIVLSPHSRVARESWAAAVKASGSTAPLTQPKSVIRVPVQDAEVWGKYYWELSRTPDGHIVVHEQVLLFVPAGAPDFVVENILTHEYLHAIYLRLSVMNDRFPIAVEASEAYVCAHGFCGDPTLKACPCP